MSHIIEVDNKFYILATSSLAEARTRVIKQDESFAVFDRLGDIHPFNKFGQGIFFGGTRFLSQLELTLGNHKPILLSSNIREDNGMLVVDLTNADFYDLSQNMVTKGQVHVRRQIFMWQEVCYQKLTVENFGNSAVDLPMGLVFDADYIDIFEVRGMIRNKRGEKLAPRPGASLTELSYRGLDGIFRRTHIVSHGLKPDVEGSSFRYNLSLPPKASRTFYLTFSLLLGNARPSPKPFEEAERELSDSNHRQKRGFCEITSSHAQFNRWLNGSLNDLIMMTTETYAGPYPYAGIPWYSSAFGRDGIITALECLWVNPNMARGVLAFLASTQSHVLSEERDAEPGKILHEARYGEMANLKEIPFGQYYGSVDSTPLFIMLAGAYFDRTNDIEFIRSIWPNIREAIQWLDQYGDFDHDGFVEYQKHSADGLIQQGWKDSHDSVFHANGGLAIPPIALCEVQGYVFEAKLQASKLAALMGEIPLSLTLKEEALELQKKFETAFWCDDLGVYAQALDGHKRPCRVRTSNAGQCLYSGIASHPHAARLAQVLMSDEMFSGWGIRTVAASETRYNPISYHNGSVWPHDNGMIAWGLARYGFKNELLRLFTSVFEAIQTMEQSRLPELFCGFQRRNGEAPTLYPVACSPQAWSAGVVYIFLQACLGLSIDAYHRKVFFHSPVLPEWMDRLTIRGLQVGDAVLDIQAVRIGRQADITVEKVSGNVEVIVRKGVALESTITP